MSIYRYSPASPVGEVVFRYANDRPPEALLSASAGASPDQLSVIKRAIESAGWQCVPVYAEKGEMLQVGGFKDEGQMAAFLQGYHFADGVPLITPEPGDHPTRTAQEWLQSVGLKGAGWFNMLGDITLLGSGIMSGRGHEIGAGLLYTGAAGVLMRYSNVKTEHHLRQVTQHTAEFLKEQAGNLPEDCGLFTLLKEKRDGVIHNAENFLYRYPAEVMLGASSLGALTMLQSGIKEKNPWGIGYGVSSVTMKVASLLIPEKHKTEAEKAGASPVGKFFNWIQEKPLRVMGWGSLVTDTLLGLSALREYRNNPKQRSYILKFTTTGMYMVADVLTAISNKSHANADGKFDAVEQRRIEALAAEAIARQPKDMQEPLAYQVAGFLTTRPEINGTALDIGNSIREQVEHMRKNPWAKRASVDTEPGSLRS